jgi:hypothetical protein
MRVWHDKWNAFLKTKHITRMFSSGKHYSTSACLAQAKFHHIYIRHIDTPVWCLFYFTGLALYSGVIFIRSLDLLAAPASSSSGR